MPSSSAMSDMLLIPSSRFFITTLQFSSPDIQFASFFKSLSSIPWCLTSLFNHSRTKQNLTSLWFLAIKNKVAMNIHILLNITWVKEEISREMKELFKLNENKNTAYEKYTENSSYREIYSIKYIY